MKKILVVLSVLAISLGVSSCGGGGTASLNKNASPSEVAVAMWKLVQDGDYEAALKQSAEQKDATPEEIEQLAKFAEALYAAVGGVKEVEVLSEKISEDGQTATVELMLTYGNGKTEKQKEKMVMTEEGWRMN